MQNGGGGGGQHPALVALEAMSQVSQMDADDGILDDLPQAEDIIMDGAENFSFVGVDLIRGLMDQSEEHFKWSVRQVTILCQKPGSGREFKDELRRAGVIERMVTAVEEAENYHNNRSYWWRGLRMDLFSALARTVYDHRQNAILATELGLLNTTVHALRASDQTGDEELAEYQLCCANNVCGMILAGKHQCVQESGIIPILIRYAGGVARTSEAGRQIAIAALANLSNTADLCQSLIHGGAVEVLSASLRALDEEASCTVEYMQALSAVIKIVGRGTQMGAMGLHFQQQHAHDHAHLASAARSAHAPAGHVCEEEEKQEEEKTEEGHSPPQHSPPQHSSSSSSSAAHIADAHASGGVSSGSCSGEFGALGYASSVFLVAGALTSSSFDQAAMNGLLVDRRSVSWMLAYLSASCDQNPYPPRSNIYGTAWKVAQSVSFVAHCSSQNRVLLHQEGVWPLLVRTLLRDRDRDTRLYDEEERCLTEMHVVLAARKMLRSTDDVAACAEAMQRIKEPFSFFRLKLEAIASGRAQWSTGTLSSSSSSTCGAGGQGCCALHSAEVREMAAEVLLIWGAAWEIERLLWLSVKKTAPGGRSEMSLLMPSQIRRIMKMLIMQGAGSRDGGRNASNMGCGMTNRAAALVECEKYTTPEMESLTQLP